MIHSVFSIYDSKADAFLPPFILPKTEMAQRVFSDCINAKDHQFALHPQDYTLFHLGGFDDEKGEFIRHRNTKQSLGNGVEYLDLKHQSAEISDDEYQSLGDETSIQPGPTSGNSA